MPTPLDKVDPEELRKPREFDINFIQNYNILMIGSVSSMHYFRTLYVMLAVLKADKI